MAVATPVLEKRIQDYEDEMHNALIKERYAKLVNPENNIKDLRSVEAEYSESQPAAPVTETFAQTQKSVFEQQVEPVYQAPAAEMHTYNAEPYLAPSGRADGEIFHVDSELNRRIRAEQTLASAPQQPEAEEEENEDLRPTQTTIQYKTEGVKRDHEEGATVSTHETRHLSLSKRDKIAIAAVVIVIVALFALIIVNSAIISGINNELSNLQATLNTARGAYSSVSDQIAEYTFNLEDTVKALAERLGMIK